MRQLSCGSGAITLGYKKITTGLKMLTIAIDFDHTYNADPDAWAKVVEILLDAGHEVVLVTKRPDTEEMRSEVEQVVTNDIDQIFVGGRDEVSYKDPILREYHGHEVDVWIDDKPEFIRSPSQIKDELDALTGKHFYASRELEMVRAYAEHLEGVVKEEVSHLWEDIKSKFKRKK